MMAERPKFDVPGMAGAFSAALLKSIVAPFRSASAIRKSLDTPVGLTPKDKVWAINKAELFRYRSPKPREERHPVPVLLVYALINKPYIFDLQPGRSFVEYMLSRGFDVYLLDWGIPGPEDRKIRFEDYVTLYLTRAVRKMLRISGAAEYTMLGYCMGAVFSALHASLYPERLRNLVLLTAPLDFSDRENDVFARWLDERHFDIDLLVDSLGNVPAEVIETGSKMLKPVENYVGAYKTLWEKIDDEKTVESWKAMYRWVHDGVPFPGEAFRQFIKDFVRANKAFRGELVIQDRKVDFADIRASVLNVVAEYDHIVPASHSVTFMDVIGSQDKHLEIIPAGHVGIMAGPGAIRKLWPKIADWLAERSR